MKYKVTFYNGEHVEDRDFSDKQSALVFFSQKRQAGVLATLYSRDADRWTELCLDAVDETIVNEGKRIICG